VVVYPDGSRITLKGEARLNLTDIEDEFAFLMEEGKVEITSQMKSGHRYRLLFGESTDYVLLADGRAVLTMSSEGVEIRMEMGRATIRQGSEEKSIEAGKSFLLHIGEAKIVDRQALATTMLDGRRASRIRAPSSKRFRRPRKKSVEIAPGTEIRTARRRGVVLSDQAGGKLSLGPRSRAQYNGAFQQGNNRSGNLSLKKGQTKIRLQRQGTGTSSQEVTTPQAKIVARARGLTAVTEINSSGKATGILVHSGAADVTVGDKNYLVSAGHSITVGRRGKTKGPSRMKSSGIRAREGVRTRLFYDRKVPRLTLGWKRQSKEEKIFLEISSSSEFKDLTLREPVAGQSFSYTDISSGRHYWRVVRRSADGTKEVPGPTGILVIKQDPVAKRLSTGKLTNIVPDTGIQTTILYQGKVPALTFKWDEVKGAAGYDVRVYSDDNMESPQVYLSSSEPRLVLPPGKLQEGTFFWYQAAKDASGKEIKTSQMNKLVLTFDNAAPLLRIDAPRPGKRPSGRKVEIRGLAPLRSSVTVNNKSINISANGRFKQTISGVSRGSLLVFRLKKPGLGDVYFTRRLGR
jgi:hypothetical protein